MILLLASISSLSPTRVHALEKVVITGSSTMAPLVSELAKSYEKSHTNTKFEVQTGGSAKGIADCQNRLSDIGMVSRDLDETEKDFVAIPIAKDGLAITVHKSNSVRNLTSEQILKIYTGKLTNWREVGGDNLRIIVISKAEGRAALDLFLHHFKLKASELKAEVIVGDEEQGIKTVASTPGAVAYLSVSATDGLDPAKTGVRTISLDGMQATSELVRKSEYRLARYLNLISCKTKNATREDFLRYVTSAEGQSLIRKLRFIPIK